jgi:tetratricopeptide (TPR) repeat protein
MGFLKRWFGSRRAQSKPVWPPPLGRMQTGPGASNANPPTALLLLKAAYFRMTHYDNENECDRAIADMTAAIQFEGPINPAALYNRGLAYYQKHMYEEAIEDFNSSLGLRPVAVDAHRATLHRGLAFFQTCRFSQAVADFSDAARLLPTDPLALVCRAAAYNELGKFDQAIADSLEAERLKPDSVAVFVNRGFSYLQKGDYKRAVADYSEAIRLSPANAECYKSRAKALRAAGDEINAANDELQARKLGMSPESSALP